MDQKQVMKSFIRFKQELDDVERNGLEDTAEETYEKQFMKLRDLSSNFKTDGICTTTEGEKKVNSCKNRYKDIVPYDHSRVVLREQPGVSGSDYINASHIQGVTANQRYIAAQGPMPETVTDFWQMLWDYKVKVILMACNEYEGIPRKLRCQRYWAASTDERLEFGDIVVNLVKEQHVGHEEYTVRHLNVTRGNESRDVVHLHYTAWPDRGTPKCIPSILSMIELMREFQSPFLSDASPVLVHCSAGCGRTGTIIVLDYVANMIKFGKLSSGFSLFDVILEMRKQRTAIVQSLEQYMFVHEAIVELFNKQLKLIEDHSYYDFNGSSSVPGATETPGVNNVYESIGHQDPSLKVVPRARLPSSPVSKDDLAFTSAVSEPSPKPKRPTMHRKPSADCGLEAASTRPSFDGFCQDGLPTTLYAVPSKRPPIITSPISTAPERPVKSNSSRDMPVPLTDLNLYSEIEIRSSPDPIKFSSRNLDYAYADADARDRWTSQPGGTGGTEIPCTERQYATVYQTKDARNRRMSESDSDQDTGAPSLPPKPLNTNASGSTSSLPTSVGLTMGNLLDKFKSKVTTAPSSSSETSSGLFAPARVIFRGVDISYPNRIEKPKFRSRINPLSVEQCRL